jgi:hypothetical protein
MLGLTATVLLIPAARASTVYFDFTYAGAGVSASGVLATTRVVPGEYLIAAVSGQRNGSPITAFLYPTTSMPGSLVYISNNSSVDNLLFLPQLQGPFSNWTGSNDAPSGFVFETQDGEFNPFTTTGNTYEYNLSVGGTNDGIPIYFSAVAAAPEPAPLAPIGTGLLRLAWLLRRRPASNQSAGRTGSISNYSEVHNSLKAESGRPIE